MKSFVFFIVTAGLFFLAACNNEKSGDTTAVSFNLDSVKASIAASNARFGEYFAKNDSAGFISCYTTDGCIFPPNTERICSPKGIGLFFSGGYQMGIRNIRLSTQEVMGGPEVVTETGMYEILGADGQAFDKGKFIVAWKQENGNWKMHRDAWNSDWPIASPAK